jgi:hypothetical protein
VADALAHAHPVLSDPAGKDDGIHLVQLRRIGTDVLAHAVGIDIQGFNGIPVAQVDRVLEIAQVVGNARKAEQAALLVDQRGEFLGGIAAFFQEPQDGRVDVARAGAHDKALERSEAHRSIHRPPVFDGSDRGAIAEVAGYEIGIRRIALHDLAGAGSDIAVARAMESVAADLVLVIELARQTVHVGGRRHGLVEGCIEHRDIRCPGHELHRFVDADEVRRIVQRGQFDVLLDRREHGRIDDHRGGELFAAMDDAVSDGGDFRNIAQYPEFPVHEGFGDVCHGSSVVGHGFFEPHSAFRRILGEEAAAFSDSFDDTSPETCAAGHAEHFVLERRAAAVEDEYEIGVGW